MSFTHAQPGTDVAVWRAALDRVPLPTLELGGVRRLIVVAAHPDDESLGAGGLIALAARAEAHITVVIATDGEGSHPDSPSHSPARLAALRRAEAALAVARLAPTAELRLLHLPDGGLAGCVDELTTTLREITADAGPDGTWLASTWELDGHTDHEAVAVAARTVATAMSIPLLQFPIWAWHWSEPGGDAAPIDRMQRLALDSAALEVKRAALREYPSQFEPLSDHPGDESLLPESMHAFFDQPVEYFVLDAGATPAHRAPGASLPAHYFDDFYGDDVDPWGFETRWYEERKRALTLASLPRSSFRSAFEPGCSIGVLTAELAGRCDRVLATDIARQPLAVARRRLATAPHVELRQLPVPAEWPPGRFDLIVLSELGYYCSSADLDTLIRRSIDSLTDDGTLVACHWRHWVAAYPLTGDEVHRRLRAAPELALLAEHVEADFRLDVFQRPPLRSVAAREGLA